MIADTTNRNIPKFIWYIALAGIISCAPSGDERITGGSGAGNPTGKTAFSVQFGDIATAKVSPDHLETNTSASVTAIEEQIPDASGTVFDVTGARLHIGSFSFKLPDSMVTDYDPDPPVVIEDNRVKITEAYTFDLFTGSAYPALPLLDMPVGDYTQVLMKLWPADSLTDASLAGYALELTGTFDWDGIPDLPFTIRLSFSQTAVFSGTFPITVAEDDTTGMNLQLDPAGWLEQVDITACLESGNIQLQPDGTLLIDKTNSTLCNDIQVAVRNAILASGLLVSTSD